MYYLRPQQGSVSSLIRASSTLRGSRVNTYRNTSRHRKNPNIISYREKKERSVMPWSCMWYVVQLTSKAPKLLKKHHLPNWTIHLRTLTHIQYIHVLYHYFCISVWWQINQTSGLMHRVIKDTVQKRWVHVSVYYGLCICVWYLLQFFWNTQAGIDPLSPLSVFGLIVFQKISSSQLSTNKPYKREICTQINTHMNV